MFKNGKALIESFWNVFDIFYVSFISLVNDPKRLLLVLGSLVLLGMGIALWIAGSYAFAFLSLTAGLVAVMQLEG